MAECTSLIEEGRTNTFNSPGVEEHALFVKHVDDAIALRTTLFDRLEGASLPHVSTEERKRLLHIVIVGGGPTGMSCNLIIFL